MTGSEWHQTMVEKYTDAIAAWADRTGRWRVVTIMFVTPEKASAFVELDADDTAEAARRWAFPMGPTTAYPWAGGPEGERTRCVFWQLEGPCTVVVGGKRCEWSGAGTPARCVWHKDNETAAGPLSESDPRAAYAVVTMLGPKPNDRWATRSHGAAYFETRDEAEDYASRERDRGAARGDHAVVVLRLAALTATDFDSLVTKARYAASRGFRRVV